MRNNIKVRSQSTQLIINAAKKKGMDVEVVSKRFHLIKLMYEGKSWFVKGTAFPVNPQPACLIARNKFLTKQVLHNNQIDVPKGWLVRTPNEARKLILHKQMFPCVLKPSKGEHGNQVFANIETIDELEKILPQVFKEKASKSIIIEEFIKGRDYRLLVLGDKVIAALERIPAHIVGDGVKTVSQLIKDFNNNPLVGRRYEKPLCKIKISGEVRRNLTKQGIGLKHIPQKNEKIYLRQNSNISTGGISRDVTDDIDHQLKELAIKAARVIGMVITGVDIIYDEVAKKPYVLELNTCSGIDVHHFPILGKPRAVADDIIDFLLKYKK